MKTSWSKNQYKNELIISYSRNNSLTKESIASIKNERLKQNVWGGGRGVSESIYFQRIGRRYCNWLFESKISTFKAKEKIVAPLIFSLLWNGSPYHKD